MPNLNRVLLIGNLTRDPELRVTPKGTSLCQFSLAISRTYKDDAGTSHEEVTFVDVEAWGKQGETIAKYLAKGRPLFVEGRLRLDQWEDKTTQQKRSKLKVILENFQFLGGREGGSPGGTADAEAGETAGSPAATGSGNRNQGGGRPTPPPGDINDEDVPF